MSFPKPKMIDRRKRAMGYPSTGGFKPRDNFKEIKKLVWHYTATDNTGDGERLIKGHEDYWKREHGWDIGGYTFYICRLGVIYWNYDIRIATYGVAGVNPNTLHISCEATMRGGKPNYTEAQKKSREALTLWLLSDPLKHLTGSDLMGHKEFKGHESNSCPGYTIPEMNNFRNYFNNKLKDGGSVAPDPTPMPDPDPNPNLPQDNEGQLGKLPSVGEKEKRQFTFDFSQTVEVRKNPDIKSSSLTGVRYTKGQSVNIERLIMGSLYLWGSYTSYDGYVRYVMLRDNKLNKWTGKVKKVVNSFIPSVGKTSNVNKEFTFSKNEKVRNAPDLKKTNETGVYYYTSETVKLDKLIMGKVYLWGSYLTSGGTRRYVILKDNRTGQYSGKFR